MSGDSRGYIEDRLPIGGPSLSDSFPLLRSSTPHTLADDGPPCNLLACAPFCTPHLKGDANFTLHNIPHIERSDRICAPPTPPDATPFVVVALSSNSFSIGTIVRKAAWTFFNLAQLRAPF